VDARIFDQLDLSTAGRVTTASVSLNLEHEYKPEVFPEEDPNRGKKLLRFFLASSLGDSLISWKLSSPPSSTSLGPLTGSDL
jgi:hypothetical protein